MNPNSRKILALMTITALLAGLQHTALSVYAAPGDLTRVSVDSAGAQANGDSRRDEMSSDGRFVVFESDATNLAGETGGLFLKDLQTGAVTRVGVDGGNASISNDGRFIAFDSGAANEVVGDTNGFFDIFVFDGQSGLTTRVSVDSSGAQSNANSTSTAISDDGRHVAFSSEATNLVSGDTNNAQDIFVHDRQTGQTRRVSVASNAAEANGSSGAMDISADGRFVTFSSAATNLVAGDTNGKADIFVYDLQAGSTTRVSVNSSGAQADGGGADPAISGDGRYVVFLSDSGNLDARADEYRGKDLVYVHDRQIGQTTLASVASDGSILTVGLFDQPTISRDGRYVAFSFYDKGNNNGILHIWVRDIQTGESRSVENGNASSSSSSLSADGKIVAFSSGASNLVSGDTNGAGDIFVREVVYGPERNPTVASVTPDCGFSTPQCTYPSPANVSFIVNFSEPVTGVTTDDFSLDMLENAAGASITGVSGSGLQYFVTVATGTGDGRLRLNVIDNDSILDAALSPLGGVGMGNGSFTTGKLYLIDKSSPTITSIVRADPSPTAAETVRFTVSFSEFVYPVNPGDFVLSTTGGISGATIAAIDPREDQFTAAATYTVTVNTGTGDGTLRLDLIDDDSILDNFIGNPLGGPGAGNGSFTTGETYTINKSTPIAPGVTSILRIDPNPTTTGSVNFTVNFSELVTGVNASDFVLTATGSISGATVTSVAGSGSTYTVTVNTGTGNGTLRLDVVDDDTILNGVLNPLGGPGAGNGNFSTGEAYTVNASFPSVNSSLRADANPTAANSVRFTVNFSDAVAGVDAGDFALTPAQGVSGASIAGISGSGNTYIITVGTGSGDGSLRLDVVDNDSIVDSIGRPLGGPGAGNGNFTTGETYTIQKSRIVLATETFKSNGTNDGWVLEAGENSGVGGSKNSTANTFKMGDDAQDRQYRAILHFPTHYLPDNAVVTQVILVIKAQGVAGTDPFTTHQNISIDIRGGYFGSAGLFGINGLDLSDFQAPASMNSAGVIQNNPVSGWYWAMLDTTSHPFINLQGVTQLRLMFQMDDNDDLGEDSLNFFSGNADALADRPHLLVEYYIQK
jgi:Tol biopolymer transport system component